METKKTEKITRKKSKEIGEVQKTSSRSIHLEAEDIIEDILKSGKVIMIQQATPTKGRGKDIQKYEEETAQGKSI